MIKYKRRTNVLRVLASIPNHGMGYKCTRGRQRGEITCWKIPRVHLGKTMVNHCPIRGNENGIVRKKQPSVSLRSGDALSYDMSTCIVRNTSLGFIWERQLSVFVQ